MSVGQAKSDLSKLLKRVEAGEEVELARNGVPLARPVRVESDATPGQSFLASKGILSGRIRIGEDFEFTEQELDEMLGDQP